MSPPGERPPRQPDDGASAPSTSIWYGVVVGSRHTTVIDQGSMTVELGMPSFLHLVTISEVGVDLAGDAFCCAGARPQARRVPSSCFLQ